MTAPTDAISYSSYALCSTAVTRCLQNMNIWNPEQVYRVQIIQKRSVPSANYCMYSIFCRLIALLKSEIYTQMISENNAGIVIKAVLFATMAREQTIFPFLVAVFCYCHSRCCYCSRASLHRRILCKPAEPLLSETTNCSLNLQC